MILSRAKARPWTAWLVLVAMAVLVRALVPAGYMAAPDMGPGFIICTGQAASPAEHGGKPAGDVRKADSVCAYAGAHVALEQPLAAPLAGPAVAFSRASTPDRLRTAPGRGLAAPPPPSTGPPALL